MAIEPYLFFNGRCEEAIEFYKKALGAEVLDDDALTKKVRNRPRRGWCRPARRTRSCTVTMRIGDANIMASDGHCTGQTNFQGFSLSLTAADETDAKRKFAALAEGGQVQMPLAKTFWSPCFGMVADRFGVPWMITVAQ